MEEKNYAQKKKSETLKNIFIAVLSIIALLLTILVVYLGTNMNKDKNVCEEKCDEIIHNKVGKNDIPLIIPMNYEMSNNNFGYIIVDKVGNAYLTGFEFESEDVEKKIGTKGSFQIENLEKTFLGRDSIESTVKLEGYKLSVDNIYISYFFAFGNGGISYDIILLDDNNNANIITITLKEPTSKIITDVVYKKDDNFNIVSVEEADVVGSTNSYCLVNNKSERFCKSS